VRASAWLRRTPQRANRRHRRSRDQGAQLRRVSRREHHAALMCVQPRAGLPGRCDRLEAVGGSGEERCAAISPIRLCSSGGRTTKRSGCQLRPRARSPSASAISSMHSSIGSSRFTSSVCEDEDFRSSGNLVSGSLDWEDDTDPSSPAKLERVACSREEPRELVALLLGKPDLRSPQRRVELIGSPRPDDHRRHCGWLRTHAIASSAARLRAPRQQPGTVRAPGTSSRSQVGVWLAAPRPSRESSGKAWRPRVLPVTSRRTEG